jgi:inosose dehydratase
MKVGINVWTWGTKSKEQFEQALKEVSDIGYKAIENIATVVSLYDDSPDEFDSLMARYGLEFVCGYHHLTDDFKSDYAKAERYMRFFKGHGIPTMNIQAPARPKNGPTEKALADAAEIISQIGRLANKHGVTLCLHPHYGTNVERADELAYMVKNLDPSLVSLTLDTGHTVLGGMDPASAFSQYADRVRYVHMKDIMPVTDPSQPWWSWFRELGRGTVNLPEVVNILKNAGFDGVLCVEMDKPRVCGYKSAAISRQYIREELGL